MNRLKDVAKIIARVLATMNQPDNKENLAEIDEHIRSSVTIALSLASEILGIFGVSTEFKNRGIVSALHNEISEELERELLN